MRKKIGLVLVLSLLSGVALAKPKGYPVAEEAACDALKELVPKAGYGEMNGVGPLTATPLPKYQKGALSVDGWVATKLAGFGKGGLLARGRVVQYQFHVGLIPAGNRYRLIYCSLRGQGSWRNLFVDLSGKKGKVYPIPEVIPEDD